MTKLRNLSGFEVMSLFIALGVAGDGGPHEVEVELWDGNRFTFRDCATTIVPARFCATSQSKENKEI